MAEVILPGGEACPPDSHYGGYYGSSLVLPEEVEAAGGLEARGPRDLVAAG